MTGTMVAANGLLIQCFTKIITKCVNIEEMPATQDCLSIWVSLSIVVKLQKEKTYPGAFERKRNKHRERQVMARKLSNMDLLKLKFLPTKINTKSTERKYVTSIFSHVSFFFLIDKM